MQEAYAIRFIEPSFCFFVSTAPSQTPLASVLRTNSHSGPITGQNSTGEVVSNSFNLENALSHSGVK